MVIEQGKERYLQVTPSGAYYATVNSHPDEARAILLQLLSIDEPILFSIEMFAEIADLENDHAEQLFNRLLAKRFLSLTETPLTFRKGSLESILSDILPHLSTDGKVVLGDDQGFCLAQTGYPQEKADAMAAMAADVISLHNRHHQLINNALGVVGQSWGILDAVGNSQLGSWVFYLGSQAFVLVIQEQPLFNQQQFVELLSALASRYLDN
jgi:hypothetical protein